MAVVLLGGWLGAWLGGQQASSAAAVSAGTTAAPTAAGPAPQPAPPSPAPGGPVGFAGASLTLPTAWSLVDAGDGTGCVTRTPGTCELQLVLPDVRRDRGGEPAEPATDSDRGWHLGTDAPDCRSSRLVVRDLAPVDDKRAEYREWELDCTGEPPRLRMWWLPKTRFAAVDRTGDPAVAPVVTEIVRTARLAGLRSG